MRVPYSYSSSAQRIYTFIEVSENSEGIMSNRYRSRGVRNTLNRNRINALEVNGGERLGASPRIEKDFENDFLDGNVGERNELRLRNRISKVSREGVSERKANVGLSRRTEIA